MVDPNPSWTFFIHTFHSLMKFIHPSFSALLGEFRPYLGPYVIVDVNAIMICRFLWFLFYISFREIFRFPDGGETQLSWSNLEEFTDETPIVVILPGLTGCGCCNYITSLVNEINQIKYRYFYYLTNLTFFLVVLYPTAVERVVTS